MALSRIAARLFGRPPAFRLRPLLTPWSLAALGAVALVVLPIVSIFVGALGSRSDTWDHIASTVLADYVVNTTVLMVGVGALAGGLGVASAWLVTMVEFPGRRTFEWALILPLAIPTYIMAYTYAELLGYGGPVQWLALQFIEPATAREFRSALMSVGGVTVIIALALYPYVYLTTRASFLQQSGGVLETARSLGQGPWATFFRVALPLARPAIVAGSILVLMEVLNEYGAVAYYGVPTFTTGIFRAWASLGDLDAAVRLSGILLLFVFVVILLERAQRGRARFDMARGGERPARRMEPGPGGKALAFGACAVPVGLGFVLPSVQLASWAVATLPELVERGFASLALNSFSLAVGTSILAVAVSLLIVYAVRLAPSRLLAFGSRLASLGYTVPGAVIAVGVMVPFLWLDERIAGVVEALGGGPVGLVLTGTVGALVFAYVVRFLAVALKPTEAGFERVCGSLDETARSLGQPPFRTLRTVNLPLLRGTLLAAGLLVFVDVLKELPLTLLLRPFDFDTLATTAYQLAEDELVAQSAHPALLIVLTGLIPVLLLNRYFNRQGPSQEGTPT